MTAPGGVCSGGCLVLGECLVRGDACFQGGLVPGGAWWRPPLTATAAGGMHPTGMHSCEIMGFRVLRFPNA